MKLLSPCPELTKDEIPATLLSKDAMTHSYTAAYVTPCTCIM